MRTSEAVGLDGVRDAQRDPQPAPAELVAGSVAEARRAPAERLANVERLRIVAMLEIVTFHVGGAVDATEYRLPIVGALGLPVFLLLNNAFNTTLSERMGTRSFLDAKVTRLVLPWLVWCAIYAGLILAEKLRHHEPLARVFSPWMIIGGTYSHLWFVPFALFGSLLIAGVQSRTGSVSHWRMVAWAVAAGAAVVLIDSWIASSYRHLNLTVVQWLLALPSPLLGFALGRALLSRDRTLLWGLASLSALVGALAVLLSWWGDMPEMVRRYAVSMALVGLLFLWRGRADGLSRRLTPLLFGVYLTHPLLVRLYQGAHLPELPPALLGAVIFAGSALFVEALRRSPLRRLV